MPDSLRIWIVNPFDPLPGDPEQEGRYATLAHLLVSRGHSVTWWTSEFSHRFKRPVDQVAITAACREGNIVPRFLEAPPYYRNIGLARLRSYNVTARAFRIAANATDEKPDVILVSNPPPVLAMEAVEFARRRGAKSIVDVQDLWPEAFILLVPRILRPLFAPAIWALRKNVRRAAIGCDSIIGVADEYVNNFLRETSDQKITATIPLGVDLAAIEAAADVGRCDEYTKPADEVWLAYTGSLTRSYDFQTILRTAGRVRDKLGPRVRFFLTGRGELTTEAERLVRELGLSNVTLTGFIPFETWAYLLTQCDVGFNTSFPEAMVFLPNKVFFYLAAGVAVLNSIPDQCSQILRDGGCGLDYETGNVDSCTDAVMRVVQDDELRESMRRAAKRLAETEYDRAVLFPRFAALIEQVAGIQTSSVSKAEAGA